MYLNGINGSCVIIYLLATSILSKAANTRNRFKAFDVELSKNILVSVEVATFMHYALNKLGPLKCITFVYDRSVDTSLVEFYHACPVTDSSCSSYYKYYVRYEDGSNETSMIEDTLRAGYRRQCEGYIIAMERKEKILQFMNHGDTFNLVNTRARFLIWYRGNDRVFEMNGIWSKVTNVIFFYFNTKRRSTGIIFTIRELIWPVNIHSNRNRVRVIEFWSLNSKHFIYRGTHEWFHDNSNNLRNVTLKILVLEHPPGVIKLTSADGKISYGGTEIEMIKVLSSSLNFNYALQEIDIQLSNVDIINNYPMLWANIWKAREPVSEDEKHSETDSHKLSPNETHSYFAAASKLIKGDGADIAIGSFYVLREYLDYLDMSIPLDVACTSFLTPIPLAKPKYLALILPFQYKLWLCVIAICLVFGPFVLRVLVSASTRYKNEFGIFRNQTPIIFTSFSLMSQVALYVWPKYWPIRWFIGWYWLFWVFVTLAYRASMVAFLTIPLSEDPIENLHDLQASNLNIGGWGIELYQLFTKTYSNNESSVVVDVDRRSLAMKYEIVKDIDDAISRVASRKFALYENVRYLQFIKMTRNLSSSGAPTMRLMKQCVAPVHIAFAYQKHSALTLTINRKIQRFQESGLLIKWRRELISKKKEFAQAQGKDELFKSDEEADFDDEESEASEQKVLAMHDLQGCFYVLFLGTFVSVVTFIGECILHNLLKPQKARDFLMHTDIQGQLKTKFGQLKFMLLVQNDIYKEFTRMGERKKSTELRKRKWPLRRAPSAPFPYVE